MGVFKLVEHAPFFWGVVPTAARFTVEFNSLNHSAYITFSIIMLFRTHAMPFCPHCWTKNVAWELLRPFARSCGPVFSKGSREWTFFNFTFHFSLIRQVSEQINGLIKNFTEQFYLLWCQQPTKRFFVADCLGGHWYITPQEITATRPSTLNVFAETFVWWCCCCYKCVSQTFLRLSWYDIASFENAPLFPSDNKTIDFLLQKRPVSVRECFPKLLFSNTSVSVSLFQSIQGQKAQKCMRFS